MESITPSHGDLLYSAAGSIYREGGGGGHVMYGAKDRPTVMDNSSVGVIVVLLWT